MKDDERLCDWIVDASKQKKKKKNARKLSRQLKVRLSRVISLMRTSQSSNDLKRSPERENTFVFLLMNNIYALPYVYL